MIRYTLAEMDAMQNEYDKKVSKTLTLLSSLGSSDLARSELELELIHDFEFSFLAYVHAVGLEQSAKNLADGGPSHPTGTRRDAARSARTALIPPPPIFHHSLSSMLSFGCVFFFCCTQHSNLNDSNQLQITFCLVGPSLSFSILIFAFHSGSRI